MPSPWQPDPRYEGGGKEKGEGEMGGWVGWGGGGGGGRVSSNTGYKFNSTVSLCACMLTL